MENARPYVVFLAVACLVVAAGLYLRSLNAGSAAPSAQRISFQSASTPLGRVQISSSSTGVQPGQIVTLTASWSGGTAPYTVRWYSGTNQMCEYDTGSIQTDPDVSVTSDLLSTYPPNGGTYYCVSVTDSSSPQAIETSSTVGVTVGGSSPSTTSVSTISTTSIKGSSTATTVLPTGTTGAIVTQLCGIVDAVRNIIGILALVLFLLGGVFYAISHFLPTNLDFKKSMTTWSTAMIIGGMIGLVMVLIAQPLIVLIIGLGQSAGGSSLPLISC